MGHFMFFYEKGGGGEKEEKQKDNLPPSFLDQIVWIDWNREKEGEE